MVGNGVSKAGSERGSSEKKGILAGEEREKRKWWTSTNDRSKNQGLKGPLNHGKSLNTGSFEENFGETRIAERRELEKEVKKGKKEGKSPREHCWVHERTQL